MAKRDYYEVLGISKHADEKEIKRAYRKLAKKYHPDSNPGDAQAEKNFKEVTEAYNILSDDKKRKLYDQFGFAAFDESAQGGGFGGTTGPGGFGGFHRAAGFGGFGFGNGNNYREYHFEGQEMDDLFGNIFGDMVGNEEQNGFRQRDFRRSSVRKGQDVLSDVTISFEEAAFGCEKMVRLSGADTPGAVQTLKVHIPAGIDEGKSVRLRGTGRSGTGGGTSGDLLLKVHITPKPGYERKGADVYTNVEIPYTTAVFGGEAQVDTLYGKVVCRIPAGIQPGNKIRLKGKGIVSMKDPTVYGDEYVTVQIRVPRNLSPEAKQKLREYEQLCRRSA